MEESGFLVKHGRGGVISFLAPGQDKPTRLRASTLGDGFDPEDIRAVIAGERPIPELPQEAPAPARRVNLIIDIQERMAPVSYTHLDVYKRQIPMCSFPYCRRFTRGNGRLPRWMAPCKCSLTSSIF